MPENDPVVENQARQVIWDFLLERRRSDRRRCYLVSYPRSGNTLVRDHFAILQGRPQFSVYPEDVLQPKGAALTEALDHVDLIKSHEMPANDDPVIYLVRDGRNATLSFLYMSLLFGGHQFSDLTEVSDAVRWLDRAEGSWADHVAQALAQNDRRPMLFVRYEDLTTQPEVALAGMIHFMDADVPAAILADCAHRQKQSDNYAENPYNGFRHQPAPGSIYDLLQKHRRGAYWQRIFDDRSRLYFHESGATSALLRFGYESDEDWWKG